jgi:hypothetical protein
MKIQENTIAWNPQQTRQIKLCHKVKKLNFIYNK